MSARIGWFRRRWSLAFLCFAVGMAPHLAAADFTYTNFSSLAGLELNGIAAQSSDRLRLTYTGAGFASGSAFRTDLQSVAAGFTTTFQYHIHFPGGVESADGFTFIVQNDNAGIDALGQTGGYLGYYGISNSLVVEFDNYDNGFNFGDPNGDHIAVHTNGTGVNEPANLTLKGSMDATAFLEDGQIHTARLQYNPGRLTVFNDDMVHPLFYVSINLANTLNLNNGAAYVGFTSGTASGSADHDILSWSFTSGPTPIPGDFDSDGDVDGADFVIWQTNFPATSGHVLATGDADGDGDVDGADFVVWQTNFPYTPGPGTSPVPEPAAWSLLLAACGAFAAAKHASVSLRLRLPKIAAVGHRGATTTTCRRPWW